MSNKNADQPLDDESQATNPDEDTSPLVPYKEEIEDEPQFQRDSSTRTRRKVFQAEMFSGPLPHPAILDAYNKVQSGGLADRIVSLTEQQAQHRMQLETIVIQGDIKRANLGLLIGAIMGVACLACGTYLVASGHDWAGAGVIGTSAATLVSTFVYGSNNRKSERIEKQKALMEDLDSDPE